jgi:2-polyprenyl-3-methyl-5-hydroxy-6-metoxy-1,4-benzoquinol methylase
VDPARLHQEGVEAFGAGRLEEAADLMRAAMKEAFDPELLNDLAVVEHQLGRRESAEGILRTCLALSPGDAAAKENLAAISGGDGVRAAWRGSETLGGPDQHLPERAFPGMPAANVMQEHAIRYGFALGLVGGMRVLDLGCGTGYGSEMLSWSAGSVRGFDLWQPEAHERPKWPGGAELNYGHDLCVKPLPAADAAVMFEVIEHLPDAPAALRTAWSSVGLMITSFPNPVYHGSHMNGYHVNDWTLDQFEHELVEASKVRFRNVSLTHLHQRLDSTLLYPGRAPEQSYWVVVAAGEL